MNWKAGQALPTLACVLVGLAQAFAPRAAAGQALGTTPDPTYEILIYGSTPAAISAAVEAARAGRSVAIVCPEQHLGGMTTNGLGWTDSGDKSVIGGLAREFYQRVKRHYDDPDAWRWEDRDTFRGYRAAEDAMWVFEPHVAETIIEDMLREAAVPTFRGRRLDRSGAGVAKQGARIVEIRTEGGESFHARVFIDATYEGDLMAAAGVQYTVGREANAVYGETLNGVQTGHALKHQFEAPIDPYVVPGDPSSGLLPRIHAGGPGQSGEGDWRVQAYTYRLCMTKVEENRVAIAEPEGYDPAQYELLLRHILASPDAPLHKPDPMPNGKTDTNNNGAFSTDNIGMNSEYPGASYQRRAEILAEHERYQRGFYYFLASDPRVPEALRTRMAAWGLAADEFTDNHNWPHQIYIREARRMVSDFVTTQPHVQGQKPTPHPIGMGSYNMDSHNVQRYVATDDQGRAVVRNEGDIQVSPGGPYPISYDAIVPKRSECDNLLVPVCLSSSHIAYGSIRMEPVFMILGQSAGAAAAIAVECDLPVQTVSYRDLRERLVREGQVLERGAR
ncbi:MAG: FAD-dependent oxidoreductase [Phycisphaerales bacterium]|nr:FAD-dependent oxidoreductase [Phycisphaerales bacterium]